MVDENTSSKQGVSSQGDESSKEFKVWFALKTNTDQSREKALGLFSEVGGNFKFEKDDEHFMIGGNTYENISEIPVWSAEDVELALVSVREIGFRSEPTYRDVIDKITKSRKIDFCVTVEEIIQAHILSIKQELNHRVSLPYPMGRIYWRLEKHRDSKGKLKPWLLQGVYNPNRICDLDEIFIVRIAKKVERKPISAGQALLEIISSLQRQDWSKKQNPTL